MTRTNIYLPRQELELTKELATQESITMSEFLRRALRAELFKRSTNWASSLLKLATTSKASGPKDLGRRHDYYNYLYLKEKLERGRKEVEKWERRQKRLKNA